MSDNGKWDLELVTVKPGPEEGEPFRYLERVGDATVARTTVDALVRKVAQQNTLLVNVVLDTPHAVVLVYLDPTLHQVVGYANLAEVRGE